MELSNVSSITIPEGSVSKITDSQGRVIWATPYIILDSDISLLCIKSTQGGNQYISLNIYPLNYVAWTIDIDFMPTRLYSDNTLYYINSDNKAWITSSAMYVTCNGVRKSVMSVSSGSRYHMTVVYTGGKVTITVNDVVKVDHAPASTGSIASSKLILLRNGSKYGEYKIYSLKVYGDGELIGDYLPVLTANDRYVALRDDVTGNAYTSSGSNDFEYEVD